MDFSKTWWEDGEEPLGWDLHKGVDPGILIYYWAAECQFSSHS